MREEKGKGGGGGGGGRGLKEMLVFVRDYFRGGVLDLIEREKMKKYFFSKEFTGGLGYNYFLVFF